MDSPSHFHPENRLEALLVRATSDAGVRPEFYRAFLEAEILVIGQSDSNKSGRFAAETNTPLQIMEINIEGRRLIPMFTSLRRLQEYLQEEASYIQINCRALLETVGPEKGLILNPASAYGKEFVPAEVAALVDGSIFKPVQEHTIPERQEVLIGTPSEYPEKLINGLCSLFKTNPKVRRAYVAQIQIAESGEPAHLLIAIDADGDFAALASECGIVVKETLGPEKFADLVRLQDSGLQDYFQQPSQPFYEKSQGD